MKTPLVYIGLLVIMALTLVLAAPVGTMGAGLADNGLVTPEPAANTDQQTWYLHSKAVSGGYVMDQSQSAANKGTEAEVSIAGGAQALWIADQPQKEDTQFSSGAWHVDLITTKDWGTAGSFCQVDMGVWNGTSFSAFEMTTLSSNCFQKYPSSDVRQVKSQKKAYILRSGEYMAFQITNKDTAAHNIFTEENIDGSYISGIYGGTIGIAPAQSSPTNTASVTPPVPSTSALSTTTPAASITSSSTPKASEKPAASTKATSSTPKSSTEPGKQSSMLGGILGAVIAVVITVGLFMSIILISRMISKRKNRGAK